MRQCERCQKEINPHEENNLCFSCFGLKAASDDSCRKAFMEHLFVQEFDSFCEFAKKYFKAIKNVG